MIISFFENVFRCGMIVCAHRIYARSAVNRLRESKINLSYRRESWVDSGMVIDGFRQ